MPTIPDLLAVALLVAGYFAFTQWILPKLGVPT